MKTVGPLRVTWRPRSCPGLGSGSWSRRTRGGHGAALGSGSWSRRTRADPGAALGWAAGAGATGHVAASELPRAGQRELEPQDTWWPRSSPELVRGGTWSVGYRQPIGQMFPIGRSERYCRSEADRANVPDWEIGKILPIGKMIVLFIFRSNFQ
jgi:hypothetical protein